MRAILDSARPALWRERGKRGGIISEAVLDREKARLGARGVGWVRTVRAGEDQAALPSERGEGTANHARSSGFNRTAFARRESEGSVLDSRKSIDTGVIPNRES
jgi:hypothetical protein